MGNSVFPSEDGGCIIGANTGTFGGGNTNFYVIKTDRYSNSIVEIKDGCSIVAGVKKSMVRVPEKYKNVYNNDIYLTKLDSKGNIIWQKTIGGPESDSANACITAKNGDIMVLGHTKTSKNGLDVLLMRILDQ